MVLCALVVLEMARQGTILQLVEAHQWGTLDGLSCFTVVESTCKVQTLPTNLNTITAPNTQLHTHPIVQVFANYQWEASCSAWNMPAVPLLVQQISQTDRYYSLIVRFERNTRKYHEFIAGIVYECVARVTMPQAMNE